MAFQSYLCAVCWKPFKTEDECKKHFAENHASAKESFLDRAKREEANKVTNPPHYQGGIQPLEFFLANPQLNFMQCNIIKYVFRYKNKGGLEDLKKAQFYLNLLIEQEQANDQSV